MYIDYISTNSIKLHCNESKMCSCPIYLRNMQQYTNKSIRMYLRIYNLYSHN